VADFTKGDNIYNKGRFNYEEAEHHQESMDHDDPGYIDSRLCRGETSVG
jgi:hypothetical protein